MARALDFFITSSDNAGNLATSSTYTFTVQSLIPGDINGDGKVSLQDLTKLAQHYGQDNP